MNRPIRSFVRRAGRTTAAQRRALATLGPRFVLGDARPIDPPRCFGRRAPCVVEVGFGTGEALLALARAHPERDFLGIEVHPPGIGRLLAGLAEHGLDNVRVIDGDAAEVFAGGIAPASLEAVLAWFPDPWPKKRHHKRRLVRTPFVRDVRAALAPGGRLRIASDWAPYAREMLALVEAEPGWRNLAGPGRFAERPPERPPTRFERRGEGLGHAVLDLAFERVDRAPAPSP